VSVLAADALVIGLGGNIGSAAEIVDRFRRARDALAQLGAVRSAGLYCTAWIGASGAWELEQPAFLNSAVCVRYFGCTPAELIASVLELERLLGRDRRAEPRHGPRTIDLDVLAWGTRTIRTPELEVPHPRLTARRFALQPLADLFGEDLELAGSHVGALLEGVSTQLCDRVGVTW
jgi:2-amino-4-hydroxy-6-hydroxymethyldihydropteridine diphosphokinase